MYVHTTTNTKIKHKILCLKYDKNLMPILEKKKHYEILYLIFCLTFWDYIIVTGEMLKPRTIKHYLKRAFKDCFGNSVTGTKHNM